MTGPGRVDVAIDDATAALAAPAATKGDAILQGDGIPEQFRGKTLADVVKLASASTEALRISEEARKAAERRGDQPPPEVRVVQAPPAPVVEPELTDEQLQAAFESNPMQAIKYVEARASDRLLKHLETRLGPLALSAASSAESSAQSRFAEEFKLFGKEIKEVTDLMKGNSQGQAALGRPETWDQVISFIRGKPGNFEKLIDSRASAADLKAAEEARLAQSRGAGFSPTPASGGGGEGTKVTPVGDHAGLDETQRRIADTFIDSGVFKDYAEYKKWSDLGS